MELSTGYATDRNSADRAPVQIAYGFALKHRLFTKSQIGFKYLHYYNDFVNATIKNYIWEFHQTISYEIIKKKQYIFKPNIGINYCFYKRVGKMDKPLNTLPIRAWVIGLRNESYFVISSTDEGYYKAYAPNNLRFRIQLQNQFKISEKIWLHITLFVEPDYNRSQNTGGCYVG